MICYLSLRQWRPAKAILRNSRREVAINWLTTSCGPHHKLRTIHSQRFGMNVQASGCIESNSKSSKWPVRPDSSTGGNPARIHRDELPAEGVG